MKYIIGASEYRSSVWNTTISSPLQTDLDHHRDTSQPTPPPPTALDSEWRQQEYRRPPGEPPLCFGARRQRRSLLRRSGDATLGRDCHRRHRGGTEGAAGDTHHRHHRCRCPPNHHLHRQIPSWRGSRTSRTGFRRSRDPRATRTSGTIPSDHSGASARWTRASSATAAAG